MSDKLNLDYLKLFYCEVMTMSVVGGQPKKKKIKSQLQSNQTHQTHFSNLLLLLVHNFISFGLVNLCSF